MSVNLNPGGIEDDMFDESAMRSVIKAFSWRILATLTTTLLVYAFTRRTDIALTVGILEGGTKVVLYFFHERIWNRLNVGRRPLRGDAVPSALAVNGNVE